MASIREPDRPLMNRSTVLGYRGTALKLVPLSVPKDRKANCSPQRPAFSGRSCTFPHLNDGFSRVEKDLGPRSPEVPPYISLPHRAVAHLETSGVRRERRETPEWVIRIQELLAHRLRPSDW